MGLCALVATLSAAICLTSAFAETVTLNSGNGSISFTGELIRFDNGVYLIETRLGRIGVPAADVTCVGAACPDAAEVAEPAAAATAELEAVLVAEPPAPAVEDAPTASGVPEVVEPVTVVPAAEPASAANPAIPAEVDPDAAPVYATYDPATIDVSIKGSDTIGDELMPLLIKGAAEALGAAIKREEVGERQSVHTVLGADGTGESLFSVFLEDKGSGTGFKGLLDGSAMIGMSSRAVKPEEVEAFIAVGLGDPSSFEQEHAIAVDGLLIIVNPQNTVGGLTVEQIGGLLSGEIANWSEVGGPDLPVSVYTRDAESGTFSTIVDAFLKPFAKEMSPGANTVPGNAQMTDSVFADPGAIGYVGFAYKKDARPVDIVSSCGIVASPSAFAAKTGEYPLHRTLYLYTPQKDLPPMEAALVDFATSDAALPFVEKAGFIGYNIEAEAMTHQVEILLSRTETTESPSEKALMSELSAEMGKWERLSTTFRFKTGSSSLENQSRRDLERLAAFLAEKGAGRNFVFVGFTDSDGPVEANWKLGLERAEAMRGELQAIMDPAVFSSLSIDIKGYGEINPVGCNTDFAGQRLNRRVEIWMQ